MCRSYRYTLEQGFSPEAGAGYTSAQFGVAVQALVASSHGAVLRQDLCNELMSRTGVAAAEAREALQAMVRDNILAMRPYSPLARDIDPGAFGSPPSQIVTAPTAVHMYVMRKDATWRAHQQVCSTTRNGLPRFCLLDACLRIAAALALTCKMRCSRAAMSTALCGHSPGSNAHATVATTHAMSSVVCTRCV